MVHSDPEAIKKSVRQYMMIGAALFVFTAITVAVNQVHLAVPFAITLNTLRGGQMVPGGKVKVTWGSGQVTES